jgi:hypothetical protein
VSGFGEADRMRRDRRERPRHGAVTHDRDNRVRRAVSAGVSKYRVNQLTGIGRSAIDRILAAAVPAEAINGPSGGGNDH